MAFWFCCEPSCYPTFCLLQRATTQISLNVQGVTLCLDSFVYPKDSLTCTLLISCPVMTSRSSRCVSQNCCCDCLIFALAALVTHCMYSKSQRTLMQKFRKPSFPVDTLQSHLTTFLSFLHTLLAIHWRRNYSTMIHLQLDKAFEGRMASSLLAL